MWWVCAPWPTSKTATRSPRCSHRPSYTSYQWSLLTHDEALVDPDDLRRVALAVARDDAFHPEAMRVLVVSGVVALPEFVAVNGVEALLRWAAGRYVGAHKACWHYLDLAVRDALERWTEVVAHAPSLVHAVAHTALRGATRQRMVALLGTGLVVDAMDGVVARRGFVDLWPTVLEPMLAPPRDGRGAMRARRDVRAPSERHTRRRARAPSRPRRASTRSGVRRPQYERDAILGLLMTPDPVSLLTRAPGRASTRFTS